MVAETLEQATYAAGLVKVAYKTDSFTIDLHKGDIYTPRSGAERAAEEEIARRDGRAGARSRASM